MNKLWRYIRYWLGLAQRVQYKTKRLVTTENTTDHISQSIRSLFENHNKAALGLFILSFLVVSYAIIQFFVSLDTGHNSAPNEPTIITDNNIGDQWLTGVVNKTNSTTWAIDTGSRLIEIDRGLVITIQEPTILPYNEWISQSIEALVQALNDDAETATNVFDTYMQTTDTVQENFNQEDILLFGQIANNSVRIENLTIESPTRKDRYPTNFSLFYTINWEEYREDRSVTMLPQDDMRKIWTLQCVSCSNTPLFNIERFE